MKPSEIERDRRDHPYAWRNLSDEDRARIAPFRWHTGELPPPARWSKLEGKLQIEPGAREPNPEIRKVFCAVWKQIRGNLNAWLAPGPLNFELRRYDSNDEAIMEARMRLKKQLGDRIQFQFS